MKIYLTRVERQGKSKVVVEGEVVVIGALMRTTTAGDAVTLLIITCFLFNLPSEMKKIIDRTR